jgi:hypothetical protein
MNKQLRTYPLIAAAIGALLFTGAAYAGKGGSMAEVIREAKAGRVQPDEPSAPAPRQRAPQQSERRTRGRSRAAALRPHFATREQCRPDASAFRHRSAASR